jgi:hypothetical protein
VLTGPGFSSRGPQANFVKRIGFNAQPQHNRSRIDLPETTQKRRAAFEQGLGLEPNLYQAQVRILETPGGHLADVKRVASIQSITGSTPGDSQL